MALQSLRGVIAEQRQISGIKKPAIKQVLISSREDCINKLVQMARLELARPLSH